MSGGLQSDVLVEEDAFRRCLDTADDPRDDRTSKPHFWLPHNQFVLWAALFAITIGVACAAVMWSGFSVSLPAAWGGDSPLLRFRLRSIPKTVDCELLD